MGCFLNHSGFGFLPLDQEFLPNSFVVVVVVASFVAVVGVVVVVVNKVVVVVVPSEVVVAPFEVAPTKVFPCWHLQVLCK